MTEVQEHPDTHAAALRWIAEDPDPNTREELRRLLDGEHPDELADRMAGPLRFGTAGLRGKVRAGPAGMNIAVVRRTTAGLAAWLLERDAVRAGARLVVVGRDARLGSARFAAAAAGVLAGAGFDVIALADPLPTPLLAYAVRQRRAVAGVQITASHNPPTDNGYKVFLGGPDEGAQLVEPADAEIEAAIADAPAAADIPFTPVPETNPEGLVWHYLDRVSRLPFGADRNLRIALTPLHGVGGAVAVRALRSAGFTDVRLVPSQAEPNPAFPTVAFPNPEEPGATDALLELARYIDADLAVALDPDADRCALGVPDPSADGGWRMLTGNETGALLGEHLLANLDREYYPDPLVATTVASSRQLREIAAAHGARFAETLTGFKWIVRAGDQSEGGDPGFVYGFEEALGYCVDPDGVRDKDGIATAVLAADLAATRKAEGGSLLDALDELALAHGLHLTEAVTFPLAPADRDDVVARLGRVTSGVTRPAPDVLVIDGTRGRAVVRPSGTEPKLKAYLEVTEPVAGRDELPAARERAAERLAELRAHVSELVTP
ncbi:phospho-sugar mutase [Pseudonocardia eucalypti]|uniref:Phospho-sugar mutase n=1 Tax=Pseudonocardia eucalypti TaxID=648755 RepID=A0ABP9PUB6_9PSEU|nr:phosphomannomutase [Pseudonocardia eucalypti]